MKNLLDHRGNILVVDDQPEVLQIVRAFLKLGGHEVTVVDGGQRALDMLAQRSFDLAILDLDMPEMDGFELCARIRAAEFDQRMPILFLTAHFEGEEWSIRARELGADDFVAKPITRRALLARVGALLRLARDAAPRASMATLEALLDTMVGGAPACVVAVSRGGEVLGAAGRVEEILGVPARVGLPLDQALPSIPGAGDAIQNLVDTAWSLSEPISGTLVISGKNGIRSVKATARPIPSADPRSPLQAVIVIEDRSPARETVEVAPPLRVALGSAT